MRDAKLHEFVAKLIIASGTPRQGLRWPPFVSHRRVEAELKDRGYRIRQGNPGEWFADKLGGTLS